MLGLHRRGSGVTSGASRGKAHEQSANATRRALWLVECLEDRVLLSGNPTVYTVTDADENDSSTDPGSLRYAINQADAETNPAGSLIQFDPAVFSTPQSLAGEGGAPS